VRLGGKHILFTHLPGHSPDVIAAYIKDDRILFTSDAMTPVPMIADGDPRPLIDSLKRIKSFGLESIVQGHGEMILRGEINESINSNINYLHRIMALAADAIRTRQPREAVRAHSIESCGKSRIPLHGLVQQFHIGNLYALYDLMRADSDLYRLGSRLSSERQAMKAEAVKSKPRATARRTGTAASHRNSSAVARHTIGKTRSAPRAKARARRQK